MNGLEESRQFAIGTEGEDLFESWLEEVRHYIAGKDFIRYDWENHSKEQKEHKDFWVKGVTVDVKWANSVFKYGDINIEYNVVKRRTEVVTNCYGKKEQKYFYETVENNWLRDAKCDYLVYGDRKLRKFFVVDVVMLKEYINKYKTDKNKFTQHTANDGTLWTYFYAIPYSLLEGERIILGEICLGSEKCQKKS